jgi:hypothetical protein
MQISPLAFSRLLEAMRGDETSVSNSEILVALDDERSYVQLVARTLAYNRGIQVVSDATPGL